MIRIENLKKSFGSTIAVNIPELILNRGERIGVVGNNGAGKTTLFRLLLDLLRADRGAVYSKDKPVYRSDHWKKYTSAYLDEHFLIDFLTPDEYFIFIARLSGLGKTELNDRLAPFGAFMYGEIRGSRKYIRQLSSGNKYKTGILGALIPDSEVLILDEPFTFLDPRSQNQLKDLLVHTCTRENKTLILSSHNLVHVSDVCSRIILLENGEPIRDQRNTPGFMQEVQAYFT